MNKTTTYIITNTSDTGTATVNGVNYTNNENNTTIVYKTVFNDNVFYISYSDIDDNIQTINESVTIANNTIVSSCSVDNSNRRLIVKAGEYVTEGTYKTTIKFTAHYEDESTKTFYNKITFYVENNGGKVSYMMTSLNGRLDPDSYVSYKNGTTTSNNDLGAIVTKKGLISNLKELANQVNAKIGATQALSINYNLNGGHWNNGFEPRTTFTNTTSYTPQAPKRLGYIFDGWTIYKATSNDTLTYDTNSIVHEKGKSAIYVGTTQNITAVAQWTAVKYKVNIYKNNTDFMYAADITYGKDTTIKSFNSYWSTSPNEGYKFEGNFTLKDKNKQAITYNQEDSFDTIYNLVKTDNESNDTTIDIYPVFVPYVIQITYNLNTTSSENNKKLGGDVQPASASLDTDTSSNYYTYGTTFNLPIPVASGYSFNGWYITANLTGQRVINPNDLSENDFNKNNPSITIYASWSKNTYHFEIDTRGGIIANNTKRYITPGATYTVEDIPVPSREGYTFTEWTVNSNYATISNNTITVKDNIDTDVVLIANWAASTAETTVEYWYEDVNSTRKTTDTANITNTTYILNSTEELKYKTATTDTTSSSTVTGYTLSLNTSKNAIAVKNGTKDAGSFTFTAPDGFTFVDAKFPGGETVKADGSTVVRLYFSRNIAYYKITHSYDSTNSSTEATSGRDAEYDSGSCLYGKVLTFNAKFNNTNRPSNGYNADVASVTIKATGSSEDSPTTETINYTRKTFNVKYDLNGCGKFTNLTNVVGDIYVQTALYHQAIIYPKVDEAKTINSSYWSVNGASKDNTVVEGTTTYAIEGDTTFIRIPTYKTYTIRLTCDQNFEYNGNAISDSASSGSYTKDLDPVSGNEFPYYLLSAAYTNYTFKEWQYCLASDGNYQPLGGNTISEAIIKQLDKDATTLYIKAVFTADEPTINSYENAGYTSKSFSIKLDVSNNTNQVFAAVVGSTSGMGSKMTLKDGKYYIDDITVSVNGIIQLTPAQEITNNDNSVYYITGKPLFVQYTGNNTFKYYNTYSMATQNTDTVYTTTTGLISDEERRKLALISDEATSVAVAQGQLTDSDTASAAKTSGTEKYAVGSIKVDGTVTTLYGKDTTYGQATDADYGLVKLGSDKTISSANDSTNKIYPIQATSSGELGVKVPWTDSQSLPKTTLVVGSSTATSASAGTTLANGNVYLSSVDQKVKADGTTTDGNATNTSSVNIIGSGGTTVTSTGSTITVNSHTDKNIFKGQSSLSCNYSTEDGKYIISFTYDNITYSISKSSNFVKNTSYYLTATGSDTKSYKIGFETPSTISSSMSISNVTIMPSNEGGYVPQPAVADDRSCYLKGDGTWATPADTKVTYTEEGSTTPTTVTSISAGDNITLTNTSGAIRISGTENTEYYGSTGITVGSNASTANDTTKGKYPISLNAATSSTIGGVITNAGGSRKIKNSWSEITKGTTTAVNAATADSEESIVVYAPVGSTNGTYYPVETTTDNAAVVCIPNVTSGPEQALASAPTGVGASITSYKVTLTFTNTTWDRLLVEDLSGTSVSISNTNKSVSSKTTTFTFTTDGIKRITPLSTTHKIGRIIIIQISGFKSGDEDAGTKASATLDYWYL